MDKTNREVIKEPTEVQCHMQNLSDAIPEPKTQPIQPEPTIVLTDDQFEAKTQDALRFGEEEARAFRESIPTIRDSGMRYR